ncbi:MAG: lytic transglycosylase domain-containing protein [Gammaproteobacteria bacterium]
MGLALVLGILGACPAGADGNEVALASTATGSAPIRASFSDGSAVPVRRVFTYTQDDGVPVFSDQAPAGQTYTVMEFACYACNPHSRIDWHSTRLHTDTFSDAIGAAARNHGVDVALIRALIHAESNFNPLARSNKGAQGLMQLMPGTARDLGVADPWAIDANIDGGVRYLAGLLTRFRGDVRLATAAYNAGPENVTRYGGVPPFPETETYVERVRILLDRYRASAAAKLGVELPPELSAGTRASG